MATKEEILEEVERLGRLSTEQEVVLYNISLRQDELGRQPTNMLLSDLEANELYKDMLEREYLTDEFIYGNNPRYSLVRKARIEGVGELELRMEVKNDVIKAVNLVGDFFLVGDLDTQVLRRLKGAKLTRESLEKALPERLDDVIRNLKREDFVNLVMSNEK